MPVFVAADNIISPLGFSSRENFEHLKKMESGVSKINDIHLSPEPFCGARINNEALEEAFAKINTEGSFTRFEKLILKSVQSVVDENPNINPSANDTLFIISSTKGNIDLLDPANAGTFEKKRLFLWEAARVIAQHFKNPNQPLVISNACISGVLAIIVAKRLLDEGKYKTIIVSGADILSHFVISGFQSFKAISSEVCKPFDASRDGISLGEGCGTLVLTNDASLVLNNTIIEVRGGASSNDANHISGPSRTGDGLLLAIEKTLQESGMKASEIDFISAHGTATIFNDEMEALAINDAQMAAVPTNSLKSYFGHTLGAAGIIESIIGIHSMRENMLIGTLNYTEQGTTKPVNIINKTKEARVDNCLKTASGFGGCNAAVLFSKQ